MDNYRADITTEAIAVAPPIESSRRLAVGRVWRFAPWAVVIGLLSWPPLILTPGTNIDLSWLAALHMAARLHLHFGSDIVFTFGPLGFLAAPTLHYTPTAVLAWLYGAGVHMLYVVLVLAALRRWVRSTLAAVLALIIVDLSLLEAAELAVIVVFVALALLLQDGFESRFERATWIAVGVVAGGQFLLKFNTGVACVILIAIAVAGAERFGRRRALVLSASAFVGSVMVLWVATRQSLGAFPAYVSRSMQLLTGYSNAMDGEEVARHREYWWAVVIVVALIGALLTVTRHRPVGVRLPIAGLVLVFVFLEFRRGFVRHDGHSWVFFQAAVAATIALAWPARRAILGVGCTILFCAFLGGAIGYRVSYYSSLPGHRLYLVKTQTSTLFNPHARHAARAEAYRNVREIEKLTPTVLAAIHGTVDVSPVETVVVWAYKLRWRPIPLVQAYLGFTPELDDVNAHGFEGRRAPDSLLRPTRPGGVDNRHPMFESPAAMIALACNYRVAADDGFWQVLHHTENRCGPARPIGSVAVAAGAVVNVPTAGPGEMVVARIRLPRTMLDTVREAVFKPARPLRYVDNDDNFRFVGPTASQPHLMRLPAFTRIGSGKGPNNQMNEDWFKILGVHGTTHVSFEAIPIRP